MNFYSLTVIVLILYNCLNCFSQAQKLPNHLIELAQQNDELHFNQTLKRILKPRVVGTQTHDEIANYIKNELTSIGFTTEIDQFTSNVPIFGSVTFTNIIGKLDPNAEKYLVLSCHYDSKYFKNIPNFVGAIDSAVPCAIILNTAKTLIPYLQNTKENSDISLMVIFFDGEEAFQEWNEYDSVYGSRHLAQRMANTYVQLPKSNENVRYIDRIDVLVLLDLIGAANSKFYNFFKNTQSLHGVLVNIERLLAKEKLLEGRNYQFLPRNSIGSVDDDHRPFLPYKVPILHLIDTPFPKQWHTEDDNEENLHWPSIRNFNKVLRIFVYHFLTNRNGAKI